MLPSTLAVPKLGSSNPSSSFFFWNAVLFWFLLPLPIIDSVNGFLNNGGNEGGLSIGIVYRGLLILCCLIAIIRFPIQLRTILVACAILIAGIAPHFLDVFSSSFLSGVIKTILPLLLIEALLRSPDNRNDTRLLLEKLLDCWIFLFPFTILFPYVLGLGFETYGDGTVGYKGYYYAQNDICFVLIAMFFVSCVRFSKTTSLSSLAAMILNGTCLMLLGMKSGYILMILAIAYCILRSGRTVRKRVVGLMAIVIILGVALFALFGNAQSIVERWLFFSGNASSFASFFTSGRIDRIGVAADGLNALYGTWAWALFGSGAAYAQFIQPYAFIEMDPFDIFFQFGIVGTALLFGYYGRFFVKKVPEERAWIKVLLAFAFAMSLLAGHVVNSALSGTVLAVICALIHSSAYHSIKAPDLQDAVSIVIPVYNVEKQLPKCIESVLSQTYSNIEVILVDDGSTDSSGAICDKYSNKDNFLVIHKSNGGLSDARNVGIDAAKGEWLFFLDSDDYISPYCIQAMMEVAYLSKSDVVECQFVEVAESEPIHWREPSYYYMTRYDDKALEAFLDYDGSWIMAWNKLYRRELFAEIRFPRGKLNEDEFTTPYLVEKCSSYTCLQDTLYAYVRRPGSIMNSSQTKAARSLDSIEALVQRLDYFSRKHHGRFDDINAYHLLRACYRNMANSVNQLNASQLHELNVAAQLASAVPVSLAAGVVPCCKFALIKCIFAFRNRLKRKS